MEASILNEPILDTRWMSFDIAPAINKYLSFMSEIVNLMESEENIFDIEYYEILRNLVKRIQALVEEIQLIEEENKVLKLKIK